VLVCVRVRGETVLV